MGTIGKKVEVGQRPPDGRKYRVGGMVSLFYICSDSERAWESDFR
jgi:hypothetical protein